MSWLSRTLQELQRRNVIRAGLAYVVTGWFVVQISSVVLPTLDAPDWIMSALLVALVLLFPASLVIAWYFEFTGGEFKRTEDVVAVDPGQRFFHRRVDFVIIGLLAGTLSLSIYGNLRGPEALPERVSLLIADFDNRTGNDLLSGVVEEVLRVGLEVAPFVETFDRRRAASIAAGLSGADGEASLDIEAAGVVALREGINIVVGGSVSRTNDGVAISVTGIAPGDQRELFSATRTVETDADTITALAAISQALRLELGDTPKPGGAGELESFAVANLEAAAEYLEAQDLQFRRRIEEAAEHYELALQYDPEFARAYTGLAIVQGQLGRIDASRENWNEALARLDQLTERGRLRTLGNYYAEVQNDDDKAIEQYELLVERYPADNAGYNNLAVVAFRALDFERALEIGREMAGRFPNHSGYGANLALYAMYAGRFDEASAVAREVIANDPSSGYSFLVLALTSAVVGDLESARETYEQMTGLDLFSSSMAVEGLADLAIYGGNAEAAIATLDPAIEDELERGANQTAAFKLMMRAEALQSIGELDEARAAIDAALEYAGGDPSVLVAASLALAELGDSERAESIAGEMSTSFSKSQRAYVNAIRAEAARTRGDLTTAVEHANAAIEIADLWLIRLIRGNIYSQAGLLAEAEADLQMCQDRIGEGLAVFLNDRPSLRRLRDLEIGVARVRESELAAR